MTSRDAMFSLDRKVAVITGAGGRPGGIGEAYAGALAAFGASVLVADINEAGAQDVAARLRAKGSRAEAAQVDITDPESVKRLAARAETVFGGIDILVNNAALMLEVLKLSASTIGPEEWNKILAVNLTGALLCSQAVIPAMKARGGGQIINQVSAGAYPAMSVYGITKLALVGLTTTLAMELGKACNITVNAIAPGVTDSGAGMTMRENPSRYSQILAETAALRYRGTPDELTGSLIYLCSPAGNWITGQVLHVDGGAVLRP